MYSRLVKTDPADITIKLDQISYIILVFPLSTLSK